MLTKEFIDAFNGVWEVMNQPPTAAHKELADYADNLLSGSLGTSEAHELMMMRANQLGLEDKDFLTVWLNRIVGAKNLKDHEKAVETIIRMMGGMELEMREGPADITWGDIHNIDEDRFIEIDEVFESILVDLENEEKDFSPYTIILLVQERLIADKKKGLNLKEIFFLVAQANERFDEMTAEEEEEEQEESNNQDTH